VDGSELEVDPAWQEITAFSPNSDLAFTESGLLRLSDSKKFNFYCNWSCFSSDGEKVIWNDGENVRIGNTQDLGNTENLQMINISSSDDSIDILGFIENDQFVLARSGFDNYQALDLNGNFVKDLGLRLNSEDCPSEPGDEMLSPKGNFFIVKCRNGNFFIQEIDLSYDAQPLAQQLINVFEISNVSSDGFASSSISMSRDEARMLLSNSEGFRGISKLWMLQKEEIQQPLSSDTSEPNILSTDISSNLGGVVYVDSSGAVKLFHKEISEIQISQIPDELLDLPSNPLVEFSRSGQYFALVHGRRVALFHEDGTPAIDINSNPIVLEHDDDVTSVNFAPNESFLVSTDSGGAIKTWNSQGILVDTLKVTFPITSSAISPDGSSFATSYMDDLQRPLIDIRSLDQQGRLDKSVLFTMQDEIVTMPNTDKTIAPITKIDFLNNDSLIFSNINPYYDAGFGVKKLDIQPEVIINKISTRGGSEARQVSLHRGAHLLTVMVELNAHNQTGVGRLWSIDGEQLSDFSYLHFGQTPRDAFWGCLEDPTYPKCIYEARFSSSGDALTAIVQNDETGAYGVAVWDFNLDTLVDKSCDLLSNYLSGLLATEAEKELCKDGATAIDSSSTEVSPTNSDIDSSQLPWYSPNRWLGQRQGNQPVVAESDTEPPAGQDDSANQGDSAVTVESSASKPITTSLSAYLNLTGLDLPITEQVSLQRLNTQAVAWDVAGALDSLSILQNSDNPCVATFAEQLAAALQQQDTQGFRQINPIKQELNATHGCSLPIVPFGFSPYQP
jgi:WD40 repeat protein